MPGNLVKGRQTIGSAEHEYRTKISLTDEIALAKKATAVVMEVKKVALLASMMVCVILLCTVLRPASRDDCLKVLMKTKMSSTPMPMMTKNEITLSRPNVLIPERRERERLKP